MDLDLSRDGAIFSTVLSTVYKERVRIICRWRRLEITSGRQVLTVSASTVSMRSMTISVSTNTLRRRFLGQSRWMWLLLLLPISCRRRNERFGTFVSHNGNFRSGQDGAILMTLHKQIFELLYVSLLACSESWAFLRRSLRSLKLKTHRRDK